MVPREFLLRYAIAILGCATSLPTAGMREISCVKL